jgi:WD40 repeat protein
MICRECNSELPEGTKYCPTCQSLIQTTGLTDEAPQETAPPPKSVSRGVRRKSQAAPLNQETESKADPLAAPSPYAAKPNGWKPKKDNVRAWLNNTLNHYEVLELDRTADDATVQARITVLDQALEGWSKDHDARLQELGRDGKSKFRQLKADFAERAAYDQEQERQTRRKAILALEERYWDLVKGSKILHILVWSALQEAATAEGLSRAELEQVVQGLKARGVWTGLNLGGREARTLDEIRELCGGQGEKLVTVFENGELEKWLLVASRDTVQAAMVSELRKKYKFDLLLGAQLWLWEIGHKRLVLIEAAQRWEIASVEQWLEVVYDNEVEKAELALAASLRALRASLLDNWLKVIGHEDLYALARRERFNNHGLWLVIWKAEEKCQYLSFEQRANQAAYRQTKQLVEQHPDFTDGHFYHAANCALLKLEAEMVTHLRIAVEGNRDFAQQARGSRCFDNYGQAVTEIVRKFGPTQPLPAPPPIEAPLRTRSAMKITSRWLLLPAVVLALIAGWLFYKAPPPELVPVKYMPLRPPGKLSEPHRGGIAALAFSGDGATLISGGQKNWVRVWDVLSGQPKQILKIEGDVSRIVAVSPDGSQLAVSAGPDERPVVGLLDLFGGEIGYSGSASQGFPLVQYDNERAREAGKIQPQKKFNLFADPKAVIFSPDGNFLAGIGATGKVRLWSKQSAKDLTPSVDVLAPAAFASDKKNKRFATGLKENRETFVSLWKLAETVEPVAKLRVSGEAVQALAFSPDGKWLASGCDENKFCVWGVEEAEENHQKGEITKTPRAKSAPEPGHTVKPLILSFSPDGRFLATVGKGMKTVKLWRWNGVNLSLEDEDVVTHDFTAPITAIAFSNDAKYLAVACENGVVSLWVQQPKKTTAKKN